MKIAVTGKGGAGKTAVCALLARSFAERGKAVLAADLDTNPGLAISLGAEPVDEPLPDEAVTEQDDASYGWNLAPGLEPGAAVDRYARPVRDGIVFLGFGNIGRARHGLKRWLTAVRTVVDGFERDGWVTIADLEAGPATPFEGFARRMDQAVVVVERTPASLLAARRILSILDDDGTPAGLLVNRAAGDDGATIAAELGRPVLATMPDDPQLTVIERRGPALHLPMDSPAAVAADELAAALQARMEVHAA